MNEEEKEQMNFLKYCKSGFLNLWNKNKNWHIATFFSSHSHLVDRNRFGPRPPRLILIIFRYSFILNFIILILFCTFIFDSLGKSKSRICILKIV